MSFLNSLKVRIFFIIHVKDFSIVGFLTLNIQDKKSVFALLKHIDKTNGYIFNSIEVNKIQNSFISNVKSTVSNEEILDDVREKYLQ
jgi:GPN-loop GTPase